MHCSLDGGNKLIILVFILYLFVLSGEKLADRKTDTHRQSKLSVGNPYTMFFYN